MTTQHATPEKDQLIAAARITLTVGGLILLYWLLRALFANGTHVSGARLLLVWSMVACYITLGLQTRPPISSIWLTTLIAPFVVMSVVPEAVSLIHEFTGIKMVTGDTGLIITLLSLGYFIWLGKQAHDESVRQG